MWQSSHQFQEGADGKLKDAFPALSTLHFKNLPGLKELDRELTLELSKRSNEAALNLDSKKFTNSLIYFLGDESKMAQYRKLVQQFKRDAAQLMESSGRDPSHVYALKIDLFPITEEARRLN